MAQDKHLTNVTLKKKSPCYLPVTLAMPSSDPVTCSSRCHNPLFRKSGWTSLYQQRNLKDWMKYCVCEPGLMGSQCKDKCGKTQGPINILNITSGLLLCKEFSTIMMKILIFFSCSLTNTFILHLPYSTLTGCLCFWFPLT